MLIEATIFGITLFASWPFWLRDLLETRPDADDLMAVEFPRTIRVPTQQTVTMRVTVDYGSKATWRHDDPDAPCDIAGIERRFSNRAS